MFPENIIQATFERVQTEYVTKKPPSMAKNGTNNFKKRISPAKGTNILG